MKKFILFSILGCLVSLPNMAQKPLPFVEEGKMWVYTYPYTALNQYPYVADGYEHEVFTLQGDTLLNGKTYKNLYMAVYYQPADGKSTLRIAPQLQNFAIREENGKVYHYHYDRLEKEESLWFDFNMQKEDVVSVPHCEEGEYEIKISDVYPYSEDEFYDNYVDDTSRRIWLVCYRAGGNWSRTFPIVEGVGSILGKGLDCFPPEGPTTGGISSHFRACYDGSGKLIYGTDIKLDSETPQKTLPFVEEGKKWVIRFAHGTNENPYTEDWVEYFIYTAKGDTLINGTNYKKIYRRTLQTVKDNQEESADVFQMTENDVLLDFAFREEQGRVFHYHYNNDQGKEELWFDFNLKAGDSFVENVRDMGKTISITKVNKWSEDEELFLKNYYIDSEERRFYKGMVSWNGRETDFKFLEGVGDIYFEAILDLPSKYSGMTGSFLPYLYSCYDGSGKLIYGSEFTLYEDYVNGIAPITTEKPADNAIYDLSGRRLLQAPSQGFYIQGGKKRLAR